MYCFNIDLFNLVIPLRTTGGSLSTIIVLLVAHFEKHWFTSQKGNATSSRLLL